ncbi:MAG: PEP-CTERM sorting domain-containing protein, partial [Pirellula sp.]
FDLFPAGLGIVEKQIDFRDLTEEQGLGLSKILSQDPQQRVDVWLASDTLKAITVPSSGSYLDFSNGFPNLVVTDFYSTLELRFVPEPSSMAIFGIGFSLILHRSWRRFTTPKNSDKPKGIGNGSN